MLDYPPGWTCQRTADRFEPYLLSTLLLQEAIAVAEHLEACDRCSHRLVLYRLTLVQGARG
jgi:hypothetical protein